MAIGRVSGVGQGGGMSLSLSSAIRLCVFVAARVCCIFLCPGREVNSCVGRVSFSAGIREAKFLLEAWYLNAYVVNNVKVVPESCVSAAFFFAKRSTTDKTQK